MRKPLFDAKSGKQTVSITLNADLYSQAKRIGINTSRVAEAALAQEVARRVAEAQKAELRQDLAAVDAYAEQHGTFAALVCEQYERDDGAV